VVLVRGDTELACWALSDSDRPGLTLVDELVRLQLVARRLGCSIQLRETYVELVELLELVGLRHVFIASPRLEGVRKAERREEAGVDEVVVPDDPVA
jgi:hypothetical protein